MAWTKITSDNFDSGTAGAGNFITGFALDLGPYEWINGEGHPAGPNSDGGGHYANGPGGTVTYGGFSGQLRSNRVADTGGSLAYFGSATKAVRISILDRVPVGLYLLLLDNVDQTKDDAVRLFVSPSTSKITGYTDGVPTTIDDTGSGYGADVVWTLDWYPNGDVEVYRDGILDMSGNFVGVSSAGVIAEIFVPTTARLDEFELWTKEVATVATGIAKRSMAVVMA